MGHLLHQPHDEFEAFAAELCGRRPIPFAFDPLEQAKETAEQLAISYGGAYLNGPTRDGHVRCALCQLVGHQPSPNIDSDLYWTATVVDIVERKARERGLMPRVA